MDDPLIASVIDKWSINWFLGWLMVNPLIASVIDEWSIWLIPKLKDGSPIDW
jgi:hypothetical protein